MLLLNSDFEGWRQDSFILIRDTGVKIGSHKKKMGSVVQTSWVK